MGLLYLWQCLISFASEQVIVGGITVQSGVGSVELSSVELFPRPPSGTCSIPDLPEPRKSHSLSLLSGGRLVVCGGHPKDKSCVTWSSGSTSWTHFHTLRSSYFIYFQSYKKTHSTAREESTMWPGRRRLFLTPLCCLVVMAEEYTLQKL